MLRITPGSLHTERVLGSGSALWPSSFRYEVEGGVIETENLKLQSLQTGLYIKPFPRIFMVK